MSHFTLILANINMMIMTTVSWPIKKYNKLSQSKIPNLTLKTQRRENLLFLFVLGDGFFSSEKTNQKKTCQRN